MGAKLFKLRIRKRFNIDPIEKSNELFFLNIKKDLSENLRKEIDAEIIRNLYKLSTEDIRIRMNENIMHVDVVMQPIIETIHLNLTITPEGATFDP